MRRSSLEIALPVIQRHLHQLPQRILQLEDLRRILTNQRTTWHLPQNTPVEKFIAFLKNRGTLREMTFPFPKPYRKTTRYIFGESSLHEVVLTLKPNCYFSHYTAASFHGLTEQLPQTLYVNDEQSSTGQSDDPMTQTAIDAAFRRNLRVTKQVAETDEFRICILNGRNTKRLGVIEEAITGPSGKSLGKLRYTNLERTLIDITIRPNHAGGIFEVAKAFILARDTLSVEALAEMLKELQYAYPYHQAIGFYLEHAGYRPEQLDLLRSFPQEFDFYLAHNAKPLAYVKAWRLHVPRSLLNSTLDTLGI
jgi:hypothetical protein